MSRKDQPAEREQFPDGISRRNIEGSRRANPLPLALLAAVLGAGLTGMFGGQPALVSHAETNATRISVKAPRVLRNGMFFETIVEVRSRRPIEKLVIAVSDPLWREMTVNTMIPAAGEESYKHGSYLFSFGKLEAGETFRFKIDGQINPALFIGTRGEIAAFDGERKLAASEITMKVLP